MGSQSGHLPQLLNYKAEADTVIMEELELGRLDWAPALKELSAKYGDIARAA